MYFTLKQLRYLEAAGRVGSIANAAIELNISQSSVTAAIDTVEDAVGFDIFVRMPAKGIRTTPSGREVLVLVTKFLGVARALENNLASISGDPVGTLRLACYATTAPLVLPPLLKEFARLYPGVRIEVQEGNMTGILDLMTAGETDIVLTFRDSLPVKQAFVPLFRARPFAVLPADHPLALQPEVSLAELCALPMVMLDLPLATEYYIDLFAQFDLVPHIAHTTKTSEMARALVAGGFGFAVLNIFDAAAETASGYAARVISDNINAPYFGIALPGGARHPAIVERFIDMSDKLAKAGAFDGLVLQPKPANDAVG